MFVALCERAQQHSPGERGQNPEAGRAGHAGLVATVQRTGKQTGDLSRTEGSGVSSYLLSVGGSCEAFVCKQQ